MSPASEGYGGTGAGSCQGGVALVVYVTVGKSCPWSLCHFEVFTGAAESNVWMIILVKDRLFYDERICGALQPMMGRGLLTGLSIVEYGTTLNSECAKIRERLTGRKGERDKR